MLNQPVAENEGRGHASERAPLEGSIYPKIPRGVQYRCWRWNAGCVSLVMAAIVVILWMRTLVYADRIWWTVQSRTVAVCSLRGGASFTIYGTQLQPPHGWDAPAESLVARMYKQATLGEIVKTQSAATHAGYVMYWQAA